MRTPALAAALLLSVALVSGCTPGAAPGATPGGAAPGATPGGAAPDSTPLPSATLGDGTCRGLELDAAMYEVNPNFALLPEFQPDAGSATADALDLGGTVCRWQNLGNGTTIDVGVAEADAATLLQLHDGAVQNSQIAVDQTADETYFIVDDGTGREQVFHGDYWITIESAAFGSAADAAGLIAAIVASIG